MLNLKHSACVQEKSTYSSACRRKYCLSHWFVKKKKPNNHCWKNSIRSEWVFVPVIQFQEYKLHYESCLEFCGEFQMHEILIVYLIHHAFALLNRLMHYFDGGCFPEKAMRHRSSHWNMIQIIFLLSIKIELALSKTFTLSFLPIRILRFKNRCFGISIPK